MQINVIICIWELASAIALSLTISFILDTLPKNTPASGYFSLTYSSASPRVSDPTPQIYGL
jgi:hypothetical protein